MKMGSFIIDGISSETLKTVIQSRPLLETPKRRVQLKNSFGLDGLTPYDEEAYDNTELPLIMYTNGSNADTFRNMLYDSFNSNRYKDLILYNDPTKIYKVMVSSPLKAESRYYMGEGFSSEITLTVRPYKYLINAPLRTMTSSGSIVNPTSHTSLPIITVFGSGDITLNVNGKGFVMKNISNHITLDSEIMFAYKTITGTITNENKNTYTRDYPFFKSGSNAISWTGTVTKVEIQPRWRSLV